MEEDNAAALLAAAPASIAARMEKFAAMEDDDDDDEEICRICRCGREEKRPLYHPCVCAGSIKFVHEDCLMEWLSHSASTTGSRPNCELCGHKFRFTPVYAPGAPHSLTATEFMRLSLVRGAKALPFLGRVIVVAITWGVFIPIATCVMFRILSLGKLDRHEELADTYAQGSSLGNFQTRLRMALDGGLYTSWGVGVCAAAGIFVSFLTLISVVDFVREHDFFNDIDEEDEEEEVEEEEEEEEEEEAGEGAQEDAAAGVFDDEIVDRGDDGRPPPAAAHAEGGDLMPGHDAAEGAVGASPEAVLSFRDGAVAAANAVAAAAAAAPVPALAVQDEVAQGEAAARVELGGPAWIPVREGQEIHDEFEVREDDDDAASVDGDDTANPRPPGPFADAAGPPMAAEAPRAARDTALAAFFADHFAAATDQGTAAGDEPAVAAPAAPAAAPAAPAAAPAAPAAPDDNAQEGAANAGGGAGLGFFEVQDIDDVIGDEDDVDQAGDLNVALDELLGLRGPSWVLFHNVMWLLTFNGLYLCVALFAPTTVGAVVMSMCGRVVERATGVRLLSRSAEGFLLRTLHRFRFQQAAEERAQHLFEASQAWPLEVIVPQASMGVKAPPQCTYEGHLEDMRQMFMEELRYACLELAALLIGYITVACFLGTLFLATRWLRDHARNQRTYRGYDSVTRVLRFMSRTFKVVIIVFLKMGLFPVLLGALLEVAVRDVVPFDAAARYAFAVEHPVFAVMVLWVAGITHMLIITVIVLELRDVLHPDILHGVIRPKNGDDGLLRSVLEESIARHLRRMALSCAIYTFLVLAFVYVPARILADYEIAVFPSTPTLSYTVLEVQLPIELLCVHIGILSFLEQGKDVICTVIGLWVYRATEVLGLERYLLALPRPKPEDADLQRDDPVMELFARRAVQAVQEDEVEAQAQAEALEEKERSMVARPRGQEEKEEEDDGENEDEKDKDEEAKIEADADEEDEEDEEDAELEGLDETMREMVLYARTLLPRKRPSLVVFRLLALFGLGWIACVVSTIAALSIPWVAGRMLVSLLHLPVQHDPLIFGIGFAVLWTLAHTLWQLGGIAAPNSAWVFLQRFAMLEERGASLRGLFEVVRGRMQWVELIFSIFALQPWLMGVFVQLVLLFPAQHPLAFLGAVGDYGGDDEGSSLGASCASSCVAVLGTLMGGTPDIDAQEVTDNARLCEVFGIAAGAQESKPHWPAVKYALSMLHVSASPLHEWTVGFAATVILAAVLLAPDALLHLPALRALEEDFGRAFIHAFRTLDCSEVLHQYVRMFTLAQITAVGLPLVMVVASDWIPLFLSGTSLCESYGFISALRRATAVLALALLIPFFAIRAHRTWQTVHDALRDERYLIGKRLHNMEERQKKYAQRRNEVF